MRLLRYMPVVLAAAAALGLAVSGCATTPPAPSTVITAGSTLAVEAGDFFFHPSNIEVRGTGIVTLTIKNVSSIAHNLTVNNPAGKPVVSVDIPVHDTVTTQVNFAAAGSYYFYCNHPGHSELGMKGYFTVVGE